MTMALPARSESCTSVSVPMSSLSAGMPESKSWFKVGLGLGFGLGLGLGLGLRLGLGLGFGFGIGFGFGFA